MGEVVRVTIEHMHNYSKTLTDEQAIAALEVAAFSRPRDYGTAHSDDWPDQGRANMESVIESNRPDYDRFND